MPLAKRPNKKKGRGVRNGQFKRKGTGLSGPKPEEAPEVIVVGDDLITNQATISGIDFSYDPKLDYHCWVVDKDGEVVFDPDFNQYKYKRTLRDLKNICHREEYPLERQQELWKFWRQVKVKEVHPLIREALKATPCGGHCQMNTGNFLKANKGKGYRIAIGFMGWEKQDGSVFWEYGWDAERPTNIEEIMGYA
jgi:hypothetical protein